MLKIDSCKLKLVACQLFFFLLALTTTANFNNHFIPIRGTVTSASDQRGLEGVTVAIKGKNQGTNTDANGNFSIANVDSNDVLVFSFIGYTTMEVPVNGREVVNVTLQLETGMLTETIVTAIAIRRDKKSL